jgi:AAA domain
VNGSRTLAIPPAWAEELASALESPPRDRAPLRLRLSISRELPMPPRSSLDQVASDFSAGCTITRREKQSEYYIVEGTRFAMFVEPGRAQNSGVRTAKVNSVKAVTRLQRRDGLLACSATFHDPWDEEECDIAAAWRQAAARVVDDRKRRQDAVRTAERGLARPLAAASDVSHTGLHGEARQRYATLQSLFTLLQQRTTVDSGASATGTVAGEAETGPPALRVLLRPDSIQGRFPDSGVVQVRAPEMKKALRLELRHVLEEDIETEPPLVDIAPGTEVTVMYQPRFTLKRHQAALKAFLDEDVEGDWASLACLLLRPDDLPILPGGPPPATLFNPELNSEQVAAVTGAVTTPHAFLIQGPPGTGKTTVICEIIQQLTSRGERVLLLAPMHVAVDEVLRRVGDQHGITAIRLTWDDQRVDKDLRRFIPANLSEEFRTKIRQPGQSRADQWRTQIAGLEAKLAVLNDCMTARHAATAAAETARAARAAAKTAEAAAAYAEQAAGRADAALPPLEAEHAVATRAAQAAQAAADAAAAQVAAAAKSDQAARRAAAREASAADDAADRASSAAAIHQEARSRASQVLADEQGAAQALKTEQEQSQAALARAAKVVSDRQAGVTKESSNLADARRREDNARWVLSDRQYRRTWWTGLADALGLGELARARRAHQAAVADRQAAETRLEASKREVTAATAAQAKAREQARERERLRQEALRTAALAADAVRAAEPERAALERDMAAAAGAADRARARADELAEAARQAAGRIEAARRDHAQAVSRAAAADRAARQKARVLEDARAAAVGARAAADAAMTAQVDVAGQARTAKAAATAAARTAAQAAAQAAAVLDVDAKALPDDDWLRAHAAACACDAERRQQYIDLQDKWFELAGRADVDWSKVGEMLVHTANLVCCTTSGFGSEIVQNADFDTLIVDEASRVVDSEFLIGAVTARRWILVGDEHQLPPYVDPVDEHHLHALAALHMAGSTAVGPRSLAECVDRLGRLWAEDEELHRFRSDSVLQAAERLRDSGRWASTYAPTYGRAYQRMRAGGGSAERELLRAMRAHLVRSLFERCVASAPQRLRQRLVEQRRMIATMAEIVSEPVYGGDYRTPAAEELARFGVTPLKGYTWDQPLVFFDTSAQPAVRFRDKQQGTGFVNPLEAEWVDWLCRTWESDLRAADADRLTVSILTFYRAQAKMIRDRLGYPKYPGFRVVKFAVIDAIDRIQGQESDLVILSFVRARPVRRGGRAAEPGQPRDSGEPAEARPAFGLWLQDLRRLNVACTRGRRGLALIGHAPTLRALTGVTEAEEFYSHLFEIFDQREPGTLLTKQLLGPVRSARPAKRDR